jgi:hypothetical protein
MLRYLPAGIEVLGLLCVSIAAYLVSLPLGLLVTGLSLAALGVAIDRLTGSPE